MFSKLLATIGFIRISHSLLHRRFMRKDTEFMEFTLQNGKYDIRALAAQYLGELKSEKSRSLLVQSIDDSVPSVSEASMKALEEIGIDTEIQQRIASKRSYWKSYKKEIEPRSPSTDSKYTPERKDRPSRKSFENLKQMLRKPMNSGKWF